MKKKLFLNQAPKATYQKGIFNYMGAKGQLVDWIIPMFPSHTTYAEVFGGTFVIGLNKPKSKIEFYNDINSNLSNLFHIIRTRYDEFSDAIDNIIVSEDWHAKFFRHENDVEDELERAIRYFYVMTFTFRGKYEGGWSVENAVSSTNESRRVLIKQIHERMKDVIVLNKPYDKVINDNNNKDTLLYLDPPYVSTEMYYKKLAGGFGENDHIKLRDLLAKHNGYFFLSYEDDEMVSDLYHNFKIHRRKAARSSSGVSKFEVVVTNYTPQKTLFSI